MSPPTSSLPQDSTSEKVASKRVPLFNAGAFFKFGNSRHSRGPSGSLTTPSTDGRSPEESGSEVVPLNSAEDQPSSSSIPNTGDEQVHGKEARGKVSSTVHMRAHPYKKPTVKDDGKRKDDGKQGDNGKQEDDGKQEDGNQKADGPTPPKLQDRIATTTKQILQVLSSVGHK